MNFLIKKIRYLINLNIKYDFIFFKNKYLLLNNKGEIIKQNNKLYPGKAKSIFFQTKRFIPKGWYLLGIKHKSKNNKAFGIFRVGLYGSPQSRPMYPIRRRWRVVRVSKIARPLLEIQNIDFPMKLEELYLIPIPQFFAKIRIENRLFNLNSLIKGQHIKNKKLRNYWFIYNKILLNQKKNLNLISYKEWIDNIEKKFIKIQKHKLDDIKYNLNFFDIFSSDNIKESKNSKYVVLYRNGQIANFSLDLIFIQICKKEEVELIYGDEDYIDSQGKRYNPYFKTAWNRELFFSDSEYANFWIIKKEKWNLAINNLQRQRVNINFRNILFEVINQLVIDNNEKNIYHFPYIVFHNHEKKYETEDHIDLYNNLKRNKLLYGDIKSVIPLNESKQNKLSWNCSQEILLSIFIPTKDSLDLLLNCLNSIKINKAGVRTEIIIINNGSVEEDTINFLAKFNGGDFFSNIQKVLDLPGEFNYSSLNNKAAEIANGDVFLLLNNDIKILSPNWGLKVCSNSLRPTIGFVGAKLLFEDETIQHAGVVLGIGGVAGHSHKYFENQSPGYHGKLNLSQQYSALTGAFLGISRSNWEIIGGLDDIFLKVNYNDVDICLRASQKSLRNLFLPDLKIYHYESKTRGLLHGNKLKQWANEKKIMERRWMYLLENDPFYSPHLSLWEENYSISLRSLANIRIRSSTIY